MKVHPNYDGATLLAFDRPDDDVSLGVARQRRRLEGVLATLDDAQWETQSRCDAWTVREVIAHLVGVNQFWELSVRAGNDGTPTRYLETFDPVSVPRAMVDGMRALTSREVYDQFVASDDAFLAALAALDADGWARAAETPVGHVPIWSLAHHALWDAWIHERDIVLPLGAAHEIEPDEVASCLRYAAVIGPALTRSSAAATRGVYGIDAHDPDVQLTITIGDTITVADGPAPATAPCLRGDAVELVDALSVRAPLPAGTPDSWRSLAGELATVFDAG
jgi:uncharacterized protein (TIGR03083 family)